MNKPSIIKTIFSLFIFSLFLACTTTKNSDPKSLIDNPLTASERSMIDSILQRGLDNEALYTLIGDLKPMSTISTFTFPIANTDSAKAISGDVLNREDHGRFLDRLQTIQRVVNKLNIPDLEFVMVPYISAKGNRRIIQLSVIRVSSLNKLLKEKESFYGQFGLVPGTHPTVVVTAIEGNDKFARWRGYGYLFGYPDYAVDFYNEAAIESEKVGKPIERNIFRIPTYNPKFSNYAYAYPKSSVPTLEVDSALYNKASDVLNEYKNIRNNYLNSDSTLQSYKLLQDYYLSRKAK